MAGLQETIHKLEEGDWARTIKVSTGLLLLLGLTVWYDVRAFRNFYAPEAMEAAQLARHVAAGKGFTTQCVRPVSLYLVEQHQGVPGRLSRQPHPDLVNPPVYPLLLAGLMKVLPFHFEIGHGFWRHQPEMWIAVFNQALFFLMTALTFLLARRLFDTPVALLTSGLLLGSELLWRFSVSGLSTMLLMVLLVGLAWALVQLEAAAREDTPGAGRFILWAAVAGLLTGLGMLTRYSFGWLVLPVLGFGALYLGRRRGLVCGVVAAVFVVVVAPWLVRNYQMSGTLFGVPGFAVQQGTPPFPGTVLERSLNPEAGLAKIELRDYPRKFVVNALELVREQLPTLGGSWVSAFFLVGLLLPFRSLVLGRLRLFVVASLFLLALSQALGRTHLSTDTATINTENLLVVLTPLVFMYGVALFHILLDQLPLAFPEIRRAVIGGFTVACCAGLGLTFFPPRIIPLVYPPYMPPLVQEAASLLKKDELMMSDMPWAVAWYGDRTCVWTTLDSGRTFYQVNDEQKAISALYLTQLTTDMRFISEVVRGADAAWGRFALDVFVRTNLPPRFPLLNARSGYAPDQLFLCDRPRWEEPAYRRAGGSREK